MKHKHSIRFRLTMVFVGLTALLIFAIWSINNWWLEDFYTKDKMQNLENAYVLVDKVITEKEKSGESLTEGFSLYPDEGGNEDSLSYLMREFSETYNTAIVLLDSSTGEAILSSARDGDFLVEKVQRYFLDHELKNSETLKMHENYKIQKNYDKRSKSFYLECWGFFSDNNTAFIMSTPLASIRESVDLSNQFLGYVGLAALVCSGLLMYFISSRITLPLKSLAALSIKMSNLDFDARYTGESEDEIGVLGHSMNTLSSQLKTTIGELKSANIALQKDIEEKIQVDEMRKDFIANVSHELKTPIALIQGYAEGLTEGMCDDADSRDYYCEVIMDEANKMNQMVRQLLTLTALEFGNDTPALECFDIVGLVRGVVDSAGILIQQKRATVEFDETEPICVWADEFKIEEVITNYISNALNHVSGGMRIKIRVEKQEDVARISVYNTGEPIPEEDIKNLWTKFFKVDKARTREYGGSGIGLSIVKAIIDSHQRECGVQNVQEGVEFWFTLDCSSSSCLRTRSLT